MASLNPNEIFFTAFEPVQKNRFICYINGIPSWQVKGMSAITVTQEEIKLNHMNVYRKVKGKTNWESVTFTLFDAITPSSAQATMEWLRLGHESVTARDGYSDFYKKDLTFIVGGPPLDIVREWTLKGAYPTEINFGEFSYDEESAANEITMTVAFDYAILQY